MESCHLELKPSFDFFTTSWLLMITPKRRAPTVGKRRQVWTLNVTRGHTFNVCHSCWWEFEWPKIIFEINCGRGRKCVNILFYFFPIALWCLEDSSDKGKKGTFSLRFAKLRHFLLMRSVPSAHTLTHTHFAVLLYYYLTYWSCWTQNLNWIIQFYMTIC